MTEIVYSPITVDDVDACRAARLRALREDAQAFRETHDEAASWPRSRWVDLVTENAAHDRSTTQLARHGDQVVGMVTGVHPDAAETPELVAMWVSPEVRGQGVGAELVRRIGDWAGAKGSDALELWVVTGNRHAIALYERCGFAVKDDHRADPDDPCRNEVRMRLELAKRV